MAFYRAIGRHGLPSMALDEIRATWAAFPSFFFSDMLTDTRRVSLLCR